MNTDQTAAEAAAATAQAVPAEQAAAEQAAAKQAAAEQTASPSPPQAALTVLQGRETEASADLRRKLELRERELLDREIKLASREASLQRATQRKAAPEKVAWLAGNALFD